MHIERLTTIAAESKADEPTAQTSVEALAAKVGIFYPEGKINLGAPLYAFTAQELTDFARQLRPQVDEARVERGARGICIANGWNPDAPVYYSGTMTRSKNPDGTFCVQWQMHKGDAQAALTAALNPTSTEAESHG
jgi:hypothetical protein